MIDSVDLAVYSYVKPGAPHRYSVRFKDLHLYVATLTSALKHYMRAIELGGRVATGALGFVDVDIGSLVRDSIQDNITHVRRVQLPEIHVFLIPACVASTYAIKLKERFTTQVYINARKSLLSYSKPQGVLKVYEAFKNVGGDVGRALYESGITPNKVVVESLTLEEFLNLLSNHYKYIDFTTSRHNAVVEASNTFLREYEKENDLNTSVLAAYSSLLNSIGSELKPQLKQKTKEDFKKALELDTELSSRNIDYTPLLSPLAEAILIGLLTIYS